MRRSALAFLLGAFAMLIAAAKPIEGQDDAKAEKKALPPLKEPFTEWVTFRYWSAGDKPFFGPPTQVAAYRKEVKGGLHIYLSRVTGVVGGLPPRGSELIDKDGATWIITKATPADVYVCEVVMKPTPKAKATKKATAKG